MQSVHDALRPFGLWPPPDDGHLEIGAQCTALARRLRERLVRTTGLLPAGEGDEVDVPAICLALGRAIARASLGSVGVLDARGGWPCASALAASAAADGRPLATSWLSDDLAVMTPRAPGLATALVPVRSVVAQEAPPFGHVLVDLTGLDRIGAALEACDALDGVVLVARAARTTRREVLRWLRDLPADRLLGVVLTGL